MWSHITDIFQKTLKGGRVRTIYLRVTRKAHLGEKSSEEYGGGHHCAWWRRAKRGAERRTLQEYWPAQLDVSSRLVALPGAPVWCPEAGPVPGSQTLCTQPTRICKTHRPA